MLLFPHMDTQKSVWILAAIVVLGGIWYFFSDSAANTREVATVATSTQTTTVPVQKTVPKPEVAKPTVPSVAPKTVSTVRVAGVNTLSYLYEMKQPLVCTVTVGTVVKRTGTMYVADRQMRADFTASSMIDTGSYLYVWAHGAAKGLTFPTTSSVGGSVIATNGGFDPGNAFSFACNVWTKDPNVFTPPTGVTFGTSL